MIAIIDYGVGNLRSVAKAFEYIGYPAVVTSEPQTALEADKVVLPGVGAFGKAMESMKRSGMVPVVREVIRSGRPFLGICLGLQLLFEASAERFGGLEIPHAGLGIFPGRVCRFPEAGQLKIPQIGWNQIRKTGENPLLHGVADDSYFYFVHSYYVEPAEAELTACVTEYGMEYCSGIAAGNVFAFQFHPEKSGAAGLRLLKNFGGL